MRGDATAAVGSAKGRPMRSYRERNGLVSLFSHEGEPQRAEMNERDERVSFVCVVDSK